MSARRATRTIYHTARSDWPLRQHVVGAVPAGAAAAALVISHVIIPMLIFDFILAITAVEVIASFAARDAVVASSAVAVVVPRAAAQFHRNRKFTAGRVEMNVVVPLAAQGANPADVGEIETLARAVHRHHDLRMLDFDLDVIGAPGAFDGEHAAVQ